MFVEQAKYKDNQLSNYKNIVHTTRKNTVLRKRHLKFNLCKYIKYLHFIFATLLSQGPFNSPSSSS